MRDIPVTSGQDRRRLTYKSRRYMISLANVGDLDRETIHAIRSTNSDCRTESGITVGLIDSILSIGRVLSARLKTVDHSFDVEEALRDLRQDKDLKRITGHLP